MVKRPRKTNQFKMQKHHYGMGVVIVLVLLGYMFVPPVERFVDNFIEQVLHLTGVTLLPTIVWITGLWILLNSKAKTAKKLQYGLGLSSLWFFILTILSYPTPWEGNWSYFTSEGTVPLSGTIGSALTGSGIRRLIQGLIFAIATFFLLVPLHVRGQVAKYSRDIFESLASIYLKYTNTRITQRDDSKKRIIKDPVSIPNNPFGVDPDTKLIEWELPKLTLEKGDNSLSVGVEEIEKTASIIQDKLLEFGIEVTVDPAEAQVGPRVTVYGIRPGKRVTIRNITAREQDIGVALGYGEKIGFDTSFGIRGQLGLSVPNTKSRDVRLGDIVDDLDLRDKLAALNLILLLGKDQTGVTRFTDLTSIPHLLVGGQTRSGKTVFVNSLISTLLLFKKPNELKLLLIDPKAVELSAYENLPHLVETGEAGNIVTDSNRANQMLIDLDLELSERKKILAKLRVNSIEKYNRKATTIMPYIVVMVDELAVLVDQQPEIKSSLIRIAQLGRFVGIHVVIATQRPEVSVIDGLVKAQFPGRTAFTVASSQDSQVILDVGGAEKLLGNGDFLFQAPTDAEPYRVQGILLKEDEIKRITSYWKNHPTEPDRTAEDDVLTRGESSSAQDSHDDPECQ